MHYFYSYLAKGGASIKHGAHQMTVLLPCLLMALFASGSAFAQDQSQTILKIGTIERPPMVFKTDAGEWTGFSIELLDAISKKAGFSYQLQPFDRFDEMVVASEKGDVDFSISNISITAAREKTMDYSQPIFDSGLKIMVTKSGDKLSLFRLILDSGILWFILGALVLLLLIAHILWFFERNTPNARHDYFRDDYVGGIWDAFWWAFIIMTMGGFENEVPASKVSRFLAIFWIIVSLFFISTLTAKITSSMTVSELSSNISSVQDLGRKKVGMMNSAASIAYVQKVLGTKPKIYAQYDALYLALKSNKIDAIVADAPIITYYASHEGKAFFKVVGSLFKPEKYGILFPENSAWKERINIALLELKESSEYQKLYERYFAH